MVPPIWLDWVIGDEDGTTKQCYHRICIVSWWNESVKRGAECCAALRCSIFQVVDLIMNVLQFPSLQRPCTTHAYVIPCPAVTF
jgi:hypothetical protein